MSGGLMDTAPGGEQTQYEGEHEATKPHKKAVGQFGSPGEGTTIDPSKRAADPGAPNTQGVTPADKVRFGQSIQEGGAGGKTEGGLSGGANQGGM
ncbi:hypothetical protein BDV96DRAFT_572723 [Lophiotrema nucula]|uniref:Uncharacterized protein n=1 Tax=Lophiotrema nucula TaxID=690887 RepID=A0A6A5ZBW1_9PLEO|nr:hypothetical protein BDV96DRAFT_572723 [Lophiotrema nucula]